MQGTGQFCLTTSATPASGTQLLRPKINVKYNLPGPSVACFLGIKEEPTLKEEP
jgi:hypothetical protein